jgi:transitional endoplasmic reticulum ATPase
MELKLSPTQESTYKLLGGLLTKGSIVAVLGKAGFGKTTVLKRMQQKVGGTFLNTKSFLDTLSRHHPQAVEEAFLEMMLRALRRNHHVFLDDYQHLRTAFCDSPMSPRKALLDATLTQVCDYADQHDKRLILGITSDTPEPISHRTFCARFKKFKQADYEFLCRAFLQDTPQIAARLNYEEIYRIAPKLNAHQLKRGCQAIQEHKVVKGNWLARLFTPSIHAVLKATDEEKDKTARFIKFLENQEWTEKSNVDLKEVQTVTFADIKGADDLIESLEANLILPFENAAFAQELRLRPKRGVLLAGPPGTGKTSVGRALAHRLKSKFFLIDGTFIAGTGEFHQGIQKVFEEAKKNRPSVIFIDDTDVIFESGYGMGLYRYLLTMLDGLESASAGEVCVMMTAMDVSKLPAALVRSGRIELWLETRLPDDAARSAILLALLKDLPAPFDDIDLRTVAEATEGFTGADLKRLVEDAKTLYAYEKLRERECYDGSYYLLKAIEKVRANKVQYALAENLARQQPVEYAQYEN